MKIVVSVECSNLLFNSLNNEEADVLFMRIGRSYLRNNQNKIVGQGPTIQPAI